MPGSLTARDISKSYAAVQVLDRVSLVVAPADRIGVLGPNGIGKSTLLRVLAGLEEPDSGRIVRNGAVAYLQQEPAMESRSGGEAARKAYVAILELLAKPAPKPAAEAKSGTLEIAGKAAVVQSDPLIDSYRRKLSMALF